MQKPPPPPPRPLKPTYREAGSGLDINFWTVLIWVPLGLLTLLFLTVVALGVAWAFYLLIGLFP